jgi:hypothetical protein
MLGEASRKIQSQHLTDKVTLRQLSFDDLPLLHGRTFDGAFSNMGGLNCASEVKPIALALSSLLKPQARLIAVLLSDFCIWETSAFLLRGRWRKAFRRQAKNPVATIRDSPLAVHYYSPRKMMREFAPMFSLVEVVGLNVFSPPPSSANAYRALGKTVSILERIDDAVASVAPFNRLGDHFLIVLERRDG